VSPVPFTLLCCEGWLIWFTHIILKELCRSPHNQINTVQLKTDQYFVCSLNNISWTYNLILCKIYLKELSKTRKSHKQNRTNTKYLRELLHFPLQISECIGPSKGCCTPVPNSQCQCADYTCCKREVTSFVVLDTTHDSQPSNHSAPYLMGTSSSFSKVKKGCNAKMMTHLHLVLKLRRMKLFLQYAYMPSCNCV
jgi:hypothetical protein